MLPVLGIVVVPGRPGNRMGLMFHGYMIMCLGSLRLVVCMERLRYRLRGLIMMKRGMTCGIFMSLPCYRLARLGGWHTEWYCMGLRRGREMCSVG